MTAIPKDIVGGRSPSRALGGRKEGKGREEKRRGRRKKKKRKKKKEKKENKYNNKKREKNSPQQLCFISFIRNGLSPDIALFTNVHQAVNINLIR